MSENFTRANRDLERRIAQCESALDLANLLHETPVVEVISPRPAAPAPDGQPVGTHLKKIVQTEDGRRILIQADSFFGLDVLEEGVRKGQIR
jgi:hypothetical protein